MYRKKRSYKKRATTRRYRRKTAATKSNQLIVGDRGILKCRYVNTGTVVLFGGAGLNSIYKAYNLNGMYDVDPAFFTAALPGLKEWGAFYQYYRPISATITCQCTNTNNKPMYFIMWAETPNQSVPASWIDLVERSANPDARSTTLEVVGSETTKTLRLRVNFAKLFGNAADYRGDDQFRGGMPGSIGVPSNPASIFGLYIAAANCDASIGIANNLPFQLKISFTANLYGRNIQVS